MLFQALKERLEGSKWKAERHAEGDELIACTDSDQFEMGDLKALKQLLRPDFIILDWWAYSTCFDDNISAIIIEAEVIDSDKKH